MGSQRQESRSRTAGLGDLLLADAALAGLDGRPDEPRSIARLRALLPAELVGLAADLARARSRAGMRHPLGARGFFTSRGLEQCTPAAVARLRAERIVPRAGTDVVLDATCGVGGDSLALGAAGARVVAMDRDTLLAACAQANFDRAGVDGRTVVGDALRAPVRAEWLVLDPDRRVGERRTLDSARWCPTLEQALGLAGRARGACLKLAPATDPEDLERMGIDGSCQWVSLEGELRELALWTGELANEHQGLAREALALGRTGKVTRLRGRPRARAPLDEIEARRIDFLADPDPAVVRAGLLGNLAEEQGLAPLAERLAYLGGSRPPTSPLLRGFRVLESCACDARAVRRMLARHGIGPVEVRKRGHPEPAENLARRFRGRGERRGFVAVARLARGHAVYLLEPLAVPEEGAGVGDEGIEPPTSSL